MIYYIFLFVFSLTGLVCFQPALAQQTQAQEVAQLQLLLSATQAQNADLLGRVETLEFRLAQSQEQIDRMQTDDKDLLKMIEAVKAQSAELSVRLSRLDAARSMGSMTTTNGLDRSPNFTVQNESVQSLGRSSSVTPTPSTVIGSRTTRSGVLRPNTPPQKAAGPTSTNVTTMRVSTPNVTTNSSGLARSTSTLSAITSTTSSTGAITTTQNQTPPQTGSLGTLPASALPGEAGPLFADAKAKLLRFDYGGAENSFRRFLELFGEDPQAGEARYWLAEALHQRKAYVESGRAYSDMLKSSPDDPRAPDALVKLARSMRLIGATDKACAALSAFGKRYPNASAMVSSMADVEARRSDCG